MSKALPGEQAHNAASAWPVLQVPAPWQILDFISDLHLQASEPATFAAWQHYMQTTPAQAVFILGDLFEVWVGDDVLELPAAALDTEGSFERNCAEVIREAAQRLQVFVMHGNRDFLMGEHFAKAYQFTLLHEPTVLAFADQRWLLSHGDALCVDDADYMQFRAQVRSASWQQEFLAQPLHQRQRIAADLRAQSRSHQRNATSYADVNAQAARHYLVQAQASTLIHGHTHRPSEHELSSAQHKDLRRVVLSDWDANATPARTQVLRLQLKDASTAKAARQHSLQRLDLASAT
jgi:UDP-2,3-diacylglucosamine hydrolase